MRKELVAQAGISLSGKVQCSVVDAATGQVVRTYPEQKNLILNNGMDMIATNAIVSCVVACCAGTGTTPTVDDSGVSQISQATTTVTITGGAFTFTSTGVDGGKMIKWDSGEEARIVTVLTALTATVANSATVASGEFKVYRTNQLGLTTESKRTTTYLTGVGNCGTTITGNSFANKRTFDFTTEAGGVTYNELGFSNTGIAGNNLFSRILLAVGVSLVAGQALRVVYTLTVVWTPNTSLTVSVSPITGWAGATGVCQIERCNTLQINTNGAGVNQNTFGVSSAEPSVAASLMFYSTSQAFNTFNTSAPSRTALNGTASFAFSLVTYTALNFYRDKTVTVPVGSLNVSTIRTMTMVDLANAIDPDYQTFTFIMDSDQTKDNLHTLTIVIRTTWSRTLA